LFLGEGVGFFDIVEFSWHEIQCVYYGVFWQEGGDKSRRS
jgi:hypothetical protein